MNMTQEEHLLQLQAVRGKEVAGDFDLTLLTDMEEAGNDDWLATYAIGTEPDWSAGINGGATSPWFPTPNEAWAWCFNNKDFLEGIYGDEQT